MADAFADGRTRTLAARFLLALDSDPRAEIVPLSEPLYARGLALYRDRPDKGWSLTDCISFVVMKEMGLSEAFTGDHHFSQAGYVPLLVES